MTLSERAAYLKGLKEGLKLNTETSEGKLLNEIVEMLEDVALSVNDLEDCTSAISDELDLIEEEIEEIEDIGGAGSLQGESSVDPLPFREGGDSEPS